MRLLLTSAVSAIAILAAAPAFAEDAPAAAPVKDLVLSGSVALLSDYRLRGVSQTDKGFTLQGSLTLTHKSGFYVGIFSSNLAGWGTFGGPNLEADAIGGYKHSLGTGAIDVGLTWYMYPGGASKTDYAEPYVKVSGTLGPVSALLGVAYAPKQQALGNWYATPTSRIGSSYDNIYVWGDFSAAIPGTPLTPKAHVGYSKGNPGLGPNGTSIAPTGSYLDYLVGVDVATGTPVTLGVAFIGTNISTKDSLYLQPNFSSTKDGSSIAKGKVVFSITAAF